MDENLTQAIEVAKKQYITSNKYFLETATNEEYIER